MLESRLETRKAAVQKILDASAYVILCIDGWSSRRTQSYLGMVAHVIMPDWTEHCLVLTCEHFPESHTGQAMADWTLKQIDDFKLHSELVKVVPHISGYV